MYKFHTLIYAFLLNLNKSCYQHEYAKGNVSCDRQRGKRGLRMRIEQTVNINEPCNVIGKKYF